MSKSDQELPELVQWFCEWAGLPTKNVYDSGPHVKIGGPVKVVGERPAEPVTLEVVLDALATEGFVPHVGQIAISQGAPVWEATVGDFIVFCRVREEHANRLIALLRAAKQAVQADTFVPHLAEKELGLTEADRDFVARRAQLEQDAQHTDRVVSGGG